MRILRRVREERCRAAPLLAVVRRRGLDERELRLATEILYGTLRWRQALEAIVRRLCRRKPPAAEIADILHLALYQILFLERVPAHAAVNRAVDQARSLGGAPAASFVNAVLRRASRAGRGLLAQTGTEDAQRLALRYSHPPWLVRRWLQRWGAAEVVALLEFNQQTPEVALWPVPDRGDLISALRALGTEPQPSRFVPGALRARGGTLAFSPLHEQGAFVIQDEASQLVAGLLERPLRGAVLDLCAGTGGKAAQLVSSASSSTLVVASDRSRAALKGLRRRFQRLRLPAPPLVRTDWEAGRALCARFAVVLVDAPCTGTGVLRRRPEIKLRLKPQDVGRLAKRQNRLLEVAGQLTAPRGQLLYAVCSLEPEEGSQRVDEFLRRHPEFARAGAGSGFPPSASRLLDEHGDLATLPWRDSIDGFYACRLRRRA